ncbi:hypothetical protein [sulfur-oxidizing endosymbiont of Gigantopelta aegis]|uniref:hypothetical protein n=1 Tax=sulfur-oxidizing endosymbiont of Gigantopelta aegis TaxID=2794934 RepID=UPI0018DD5147|nr:hypothetical protein [sulfur-oxidizing endosymbiont of Gigantopelta aegis]
MAVSENNAHYGHRLRVYRKIGDVIYDEVYYLTDNGNPVSKKREREIRALAKARDLELLEFQAEYLREVDEANPVKFHSDGRIIGLTRQQQQSNDRTIDIFKLRIRLPDGSISWGSISIDLHGFDEAFDLALERIVEILDINKRTKIYRQMKSAKKAY